jgi:dihydrofolate reductase
MARRVRYNVAMTLDGFIADPDGGYDWIIMDPAIDFAALFGEFDTLVMGRKTFEVTASTEFMEMLAGKEVVVFSRTLKPEDYPGLTIADSPEITVRALKARPGKDIWLFGGGVLFRQLVDAGLVDTVEVAVMPVLLTRGLPVLPPGEQVRGLQLASSKTLPSGIVMLSYDLTVG